MRLWIAVLLGLTACLPEPSRPVVRERTGNVWADCYRRFRTAGDREEDLARLASACAIPARMRPLGPAHAGAQGEADPAERLVFLARRGRCYRAFAVAGPGVDDLDVAVYDAGGHLVAGDVTGDRFPIVPPRGPLCAPDDGRYTLAVSVRRGHGDYLLQLWGTAGDDDGRE